MSGVKVVLYQEGRDDERADVVKWLKEKVLPTAEGYKSAADLVVDISDRLEAVEHLTKKSMITISGGDDEPTVPLVQFNAPEEMIQLMREFLTSMELLVSRQVKGIGSESSRRQG
jgi:hypothetical protein